MKQYLDIVREVLAHGTRKENRTSVDTLSTFNINYEVDLADGFPLLTTKEISWKNICAEVLWFLSGRTDIGLLKKHGCKFWDAWADEHGRVPSAYGNFWRHFPVEDDTPERRIYHTHGSSSSVGTNDQIAWAIDTLKRDPMSRRVVVSAWAPGNAQTSKLPPCHAMFILNVQNLRCNECTGTGVTYDSYGDGFVCPVKCEGRVTPRLCLHLTQRSCDVALGIPYNIAGYALLLELFARFTCIKAGVFAHTLVDAHVYTSKPDGSMAEYDHVPRLWEQLEREPHPLPRLHIDESIQSLADVEALLELDTADIMSKFVLDGYNPWPALSFKVAV